jgi:RNA polymerase sigma-70 factor, ECF subfamily
MDDRSLWRILERWNLIRPPTSNLDPFNYDRPRDSAARQPCGDAELMSRARAGDRAAYGKIVLLYQDRLFNALLRLVGEANEASDLTRQTFTRGLTQIEHFDLDWPTFTWLLRIGIELAMDKLKRDRRRRIFVADAETSHQVVLEALSRLDPLDRAVVILREIEGLERKQIATALNLPAAALGGRLLRARLALRDELQEYYGQH